MGLDMYLEKCDRKAYGYRNVDIDKMKVDNPALYDELKPFIVTRGKYSHWESFFTEVGYWRKANAIHKWFVENVQNDVDDCDTYEVSKEQLEELLDVCTKVRDCSKLTNGLVQNGLTLQNGEWTPCMEEGKYIEDTTIAESLLPTTDGFFFGSTNYDEYYYADIVDTIDIITKALETIDFDREMVVYTSRW